MGDFLTVEENLRCAMRFFGRATGSGDIQNLDGAIAIFSGLDYGVFNIALLTRAVGGDDGTLEARLREIAGYFKDRTLRWSVWLCEDLLDAQARRRARQIFSEYGMRAISHPPGMVARVLPPPVRQLPAIECRPVTDTPMRRAFAEITSLTFDIPYTIAQTVYTREQAWKGDYQGFVGLVQGRPVAIAAIVVAAGVIGVYSLGTLPAFRRQGYGEALLRLAAAETQRRTGLENFVLQSTEAGYSLYRRMGFRDAAKFAVYLTK
jgi:ribosomal protein S18 acetylase RimI-like enzyme